MYRAKVEQVSGSSVRAGGKWLTCIGNKIVHVGDFVYTDGRCVYGYEQESSSPLVITPTKEELVIPISFSSYEDYRISKNIRLSHSPKRLKLLTTLKTKVKYCPSSYGNFKCLAANIASNQDEYVLLASTKNNSSNGALTFSIRKNDDIANSSSHYFTDAYSYAASTIESEAESNMAKGGESSNFLVAHTRMNWGQISLDPDYIPEVAIECARNCDLVMEYTAYQCSSPDVYPFNYGGLDIVAGFIENESNWYILVNSSVEATAWGVLPPLMTDRIFARSIGYMRSYSISCLETSIEVNTHCTYLINQNGVHLLFKGAYKNHWIESSIAETPECAIVREKAGLGELTSRGKDEDTELFFDTSGYVNQIFPMPDDFYFIINQIISEPCYFHYPAWMKVTIYTPSDDAIITAVFRIGTYLTACKLHTGLFLLGVYVPNNNGGVSYYIEDGGELTWVQISGNGATSRHIEQIHSANPPCLPEGLYLCRNGELEQLSIGTLDNQNLRTIKKYKKWWERAQAML